MLRIFSGTLALLLVALSAAYAAEFKDGGDKVIVRTPCGQSAVPKKHFEAIRNYMDRARAHVLAQMQWPAQRPPAGLVCVSLTANRAGTITSRRIGRSGGVYLDKLALAMLASVRSVPAPPPGAEASTTIRVPLKF